MRTNTGTVTKDTITQDTITQDTIAQDTVIQDTVTSATVAKDTETQRYGNSRVDQRDEGLGGEVAQRPVIVHLKYT